MFEHRQLPELLRHDGFPYSHLDDQFRLHNKPSRRRTSRIPRCICNSEIDLSGNRHLPVLPPKTRPEVEHTVNELKELQRTEHSK